MLAILGAVTLWSHTTPFRLADKTLVAWVSPSTLDQRGGSVLTIEHPGGVFDGIVFGELKPATWMAGSDFYHRTAADQSSFPTETAGSVSDVAVAVVYRGRQVEIYRNGRRYAAYAVASPAVFGEDSQVLLGLRHSDAAPADRFFKGSISEARIYSRALTANEVAKLRAHDISDVKPAAWWDFRGGVVKDRIGSFPVTRLEGACRVGAGRLWLDPEGGYLRASMSEASDQPQDVAMAMRNFRERLLKDPYRPGYHFAIPEGVAMPFDPDGAIYWKGRYHLFYIFQDKRGHNWGHVSSTDLFHWRHHPTGLVDGMFSGNCFLNKDGRPTICYHQVGLGDSLAVAQDDELNVWKKLDSNPITPKTEPGDPMHARYRSWDPYCWIENGMYYAIFGGNRPGVVKSPTMAGEWKYVGDLMANAVPGVGIDEDVSCADFFKLGNKRMLLCISHRLGCRYYLGDWKNEQFHPTFHAPMSWVDNSFFAPRSLEDDKGRRIMWSWIFDRPGFGVRSDAGWSGTMSLPRVLSLDKSGGLSIEPPAEIAQLRYNPVSVPTLSVDTGGERTVEGFSGNSLEINAELSSQGAKEYGIEVCCSPDGSEHTRVSYDAEDGKLKVDTTRSSLSDEPKSVEAGPLKLRRGEPLRLRVFVDKSVVEVFANGRQAVMRRIYPTRADSVGVRVFAAGGGATVSKLKAWQMMPSNPY
ncbi:MAG TPA: GH32 C-terminal domain-containing protein [Fimbriimonadaceae bacterium]|nr:GH32 C-terminal domain-containing protein [Fimbriimonadaceae bacterium]